MKTRCYLVVVIVLTAQCFGIAAEPCRIARQIESQPKYASRKPTFCLLTLGVEAKIRIWLVRDGDTLYVDRNADGDLTDSGERFMVKEEKGFVVPGVVSRGFVVPTIADPRYSDLRVSWQSRGKQILWVSILVDEKYRQYSILKASATKPEYAPIVSFDGAQPSFRYDAVG